MLFKKRTSSIASSNVGKGKTEPLHLYILAWNNITVFLMIATNRLLRFPHLSPSTFGHQLVPTSILLAGREMVDSPFLYPLERQWAASHRFKIEAKEGGGAKGLLGVSTYLYFSDRLGNIYYR